MSESSSSSVNKAIRPVRRIGLGLNVTIQVILFLTVVIAANYLSCARHQRYDLTERKDFTLSKLSQQYLKSSPLQERKEPIHIIAIIRRSSPHYTRIYNLLDEYKRIAGDAIKLELIDPLRQTDKTLEIENTYGHPYTDDVIIIDGRSQLLAKSEKPKAENNTKQENREQTLSTFLRTAYIKDLYIEDSRRNIVAWQDEDIITSSIIGAIEGEPRKIYYARDKIDLENAGSAPTWKVIGQMLHQQNIQLTPILMAETKSIPKDASGFAIIAPQYDFNEREIKVLQEYWDRQKASLFITLNPKTRLSNLHIFMRNYGISPRYDQVITVQNGQTVSNVQAIFSQGGEINEQLGGKSTIFDGASCSLEIRENDSSLINKRIQAFALVKTIAGWWGETRYKEENPEYNVEEDNLSPLYLAGAVIRGRASSDETSNLVSKMVVIGNTDFLSQNKTRPEQADFVKSSVNWLIGRDELIGIGPKKLFRHKLTILSAHNTFISRLILIFLPAGAILAALIVWNIRRA